MLTSPSFLPWCTSCGHLSALSVAIFWKACASVSRSPRAEHPSIFSQNCSVVPPPLGTYLSVTSYTQILKVLHACDDLSLKSVSHPTVLNAWSHCFQDDLSISIFSWTFATTSTSILYSTERENQRHMITFPSSWCCIYLPHQIITAAEDQIQNIAPLSWFMACLVSLVLGKESTVATKNVFAGWVSALSHVPLMSSWSHGS